VASAGDAARAPLRLGSAIRIRTRLAQVAGDCVARADLPQLRDIHPAPRLGIRAGGSKAYSNKFAADSPLERDGFEPSVPLPGSYDVATGCPLRPHRMSVTPPPVEPAEQLFGPEPQEREFVGALC
jgi:hypothetical protein